MKSPRIIALGVCLAVIAAGLVFVLYSAVSSGLLRNTQTHCASNLKLIGLAMAQYAQDYNETYPRSWFGRDAGASDDQSNYKWMDAIYPYVKKTEYFTCPADKNSSPYRFRSGTHYGSYVMNNAYYTPGDQYTPPSGVKISEMEVVNLTVLVTDGGGNFQFAWPDTYNAPPIIGDYPRTLGAIRGRHRDNAGAPGFAIPLYCDGHILGNSLEYVAKPAPNGVYAGFTIEDD